MKLRHNMLATSALVACAAFDSGQPGWKMDGDKIAVDGDGNPVYINSTGAEQSVKGDTVAGLNAEAKMHRTAKETAEAALAKFNGIDPDVARKAIETVGNIDAKKLIDAGEVEKVRETIKAEYAGQLAERDKLLADSNLKIENMLIDGVFKGNEFITEKVAMPGDFFQAAMRSNFKVEDGKIVAYDRSGNRLMSKRSVGEYADPSEALELLVESHPQRDTILRAPAGGGSGNNGGGGNRGASRIVRRAEFDALSPMQQAETAGLASKGELSIVD